MNNKVFAIMASCAISLIAVPALAQSQAMPEAGQGQAMSAQQEQQLFQERKADILSRLQKVESCIQAANDQQALIACLPHRRRRMQQQGQGMMRGGNGPGMMQQGNSGR